MENNGNEVTLERIKEVIEDSNLNYKDFARSIGVSRAAIYSWMSGEVGTIKANVLMNIASRYGVSIQWLLGEDVPKLAEKDSHKNKRSIICKELLECSDDDLDKIQKFIDAFIKKEDK